MIQAWLHSRNKKIKCWLAWVSDFMGKERKTGKVAERNKARDPEGGKAEGGRASRGQDCIAEIKMSASV